MRKRKREDEIPLIDKVTLTVPEAGVVAGVGKDTLYAAIKSRALVSRMAGSRRIILRTDLDAWLHQLPIGEP